MSAPRLRRQCGEAFRLAISMSGQQAVSMDGRGRISFPMQFRNVIGDQLYVSPDTEYRGYLVVRNEEGYMAHQRYLYDEGLKNGEDPEDIRDAIRDFSMDTAMLSPDKNGRITLTDTLIQYAGLSAKVVFIGMGEEAEIWDADQLAAYTQRRREENQRKRLKKNADRKARLIKEGLADDE